MNKKAEAMAFAILGIVILVAVIGLMMLFNSSVTGQITYSELLPEVDIEEASEYDLLVARERYYSSLAQKRQLKGRLRPDAPQSYPSTPIYTAYPYTSKYYPHVTYDNTEE